MGRHFWVWNVQWNVQKAYSCKLNWRNWIDLVMFDISIFVFVVKFQNVEEKTTQKSKWWKFIPREIHLYSWSRKFILRKKDLFGQPQKFLRIRYI